jgi:hypothetical protein
MLLQVNSCPSIYVLPITNAEHVYLLNAAGMNGSGPVGD